LTGTRIQIRQLSKRYRGDHLSASIVTSPRQQLLAPSFAVVEIGLPQVSIPGAFPEEVKAPGPRIGLPFFSPVVADVTDGGRRVCIDHNHSVIPQGMSIKTLRPRFCIRYGQLA
jgi:hypothetical protein